MKFHVLILVFVLTGCIEIEPNNTIAEADAVRTAFGTPIFFDKHHSWRDGPSGHSVPGLPQLYQGQLEGGNGKDIWIIRTTQPENNIRFTGSITQTSCVLMSWKKCTKVVDKWSDCPANQIVTMFVDRGFCGTNDIFPVRMSIGKDKLMHVRVLPSIYSSNDQHYTFSLESN